MFESQMDAFACYEVPVTLRCCRGSCCISACLHCISRHSVVHVDVGSFFFSRARSLLSIGGEMGFVFSIYFFFPFGVCTRRCCVRLLEELRNVVGSGPEANREE